MAVNVRVRTGERLGLTVLEQAISWGKAALDFCGISDAHRVDAHWQLGRALRHLGDRVASTAALGVNDHVVVGHYQSAVRHLWHAAHARVPEGGEPAESAELLAVRALLGQDRLPKVKLMCYRDEDTDLSWIGDPELVDRWGWDDFKLMSSRRLRPEPETNVDGSENEDVGN